MDRNRNANGNAICEDTGDGCIQRDPIRKDSWKLAICFPVSLT